ncbi:MAG: hypothetical protein ABIL02_06920 [candidate division WOR-3 bacterium]
MVIPGDYRIVFGAVSPAGADIYEKPFHVKGTIKSGVLSPNEHWTEEGEPYVLVKQKDKERGRLER